VLRLVESFVKASVFDGLEEWTSAGGTPQGAVLSPLLGNLYLHSLDVLLTQEGQEWVRYADDLVVLCRSRAEAEATLASIQHWAQSAGLTLHPTKTKVVDGVQEGFEFLGYAFGELRRQVRPKSLASLKEKLRPLTKRTSGEALARIIARVNPILRGWFNYFRYGWQSQMDLLDRFVRVRLRSLLRKRQKKKGRGRGWDQVCWSNAFFHDHGLFDLTTARKVFRQSCLRVNP
jgi:RNA-directed DNA polymerase